MMGGGGPKRSRKKKKELRRSGTEEGWPILLPMIPRYRWGRNAFFPSIYSVAMETNVPKISKHPLLPPPIHSRSFGPGPSHWPSSNSIYTGPDESNVTLRLWMHRKRSPWFEIKVCSFTMGVETRFARGVEVRSLHLYPILRQRTLMPSRTELLMIHESILFGSFARRVKVAK
ncbi:hypothetical protein TNCT_420861 [Trichonephila clavata]|uniref:Uncharacterized protein n=1 Tax=Trichonephila clavata TaxID=2740835 RepID=A0A8X6HZ99_TRICU|nr:hypothetical protein TNCT_420861 [Trichonephila clavata]